MNLKSLIRHQNTLSEAEVEIQLIAGIPQIHFTGLPDRGIKESFYRIKSALKSSGYHFPTTQQVIVNIKPNHIQKTSCGLELAVALGILLETQQIPQNLISTDWIIYGELGLNGEVFEPKDLIDYKGRAQILSGQSQHLHNRAHRLQHLKNLEIMLQNQSDMLTVFERPQQGLEKKYSESEAEWLFLMAVGGFHSLLAGDAGAGKSTVAKSLLSFLLVPDANKTRKSWHPLVAPHHTVTQAAFIGGGSQLYAGEIERVSGGILLLDELLEFRPEIIETLRGPMVGEKLRLARGASEREIESDFQVVATTNLCPCGAWTPMKKNLSCRFSRSKCRRYLERLSGPLLDRFGLILFLNTKSERKISGYDILDRIQSYHSMENDEKNMNEGNSDRNCIHEIRNTFYSEISERRWNFLKNVAILLAISKKENVGAKHFRCSETWTLLPFQQLARGMD